MKPCSTCPFRVCCGVHAKFVCYSSSSFSVYDSVAEKVDERWAHSPSATPLFIPILYPPSPQSNHFFTYLPAPPSNFEKYLPACRAYSSACFSHTLSVHPPHDSVRGFMLVVVWRGNGHSEGGGGGGGKCGDSARSCCCCTTYR